MLPRTLQVTLCLAVIVYFVIVLSYLKRKVIELRYTLIWLVAGVIMGIFVFSPPLLTKLIRLMGIESSMNGLFILCIMFIIMLLMMLTSIVSRSSAKIRSLVQEIAMLEKRIRELENNK